MLLIAKPYAPAVKTASRSPRFDGRQRRGPWRGNRRSRRSGRRRRPSRRRRARSRALRSALTFFASRLHRPDVVVALVQRRADQVVHARVDDDELLLAALSCGTARASAGCPRCRRCSGRARTRCGTACPGAAARSALACSVTGSAWSGLLVVHAEPAADVEPLDLVARARSAGRSARSSSSPRRRTAAIVVDRRADVDVNAADAEVLQAAVLLEDALGALDVDAELGFLLAGGRLGVRLGPGRRRG